MARWKLAIDEDGAGATCPDDQVVCCVESRMFDAIVVCQDRDSVEDDPIERARLIAAAPDLLAVCQELADSAAYWSEYDVPLGIVDRLKAAIAKATGATT